MAAIDEDWYPSRIPDGVVLGERVSIYSSFAFLHHRSRRDPSIRVGSDSGIYHFTYFDLGPEGEVRIGNYCSLTATMISTEGRVTIGDYVLTGYGTVLADREAAVPPPSRDRLGPSRRALADIAIGDNVWIGTRAIILGGTEVGANAVIGAGAVLDGMRVPASAIVAGNPARVVGTVGSR